MKKIWVITQKETKVFFDSLIAYILLIVFLGMVGFLTWIYGFNNQDIFYIGQATLQPFFYWAYIVFLLFIPALTMRLISEENRAGTLELLFTKPVSEWQVVIGKFLATFFLIIIALILTLPYYFTITSIAKESVGVDHGAILSGYFGLILMSAAYISIGVFASAVSSNQIVAFMLTLGIGIIFYFIFGLLADNIGGTTGSLLGYLDMYAHYESISRGVLDTKNIIFFLSIIFTGLIAAEVILVNKKAK